MALQGTIKDFGLGEIFQLIGIQRKTGVLTLEHDGDTVMLKFLDGQIVGVDNKQRSVEQALGSVLVRTGRISDAQLRTALKTQRKTLQRLGHILVKSGAISVEDLVDALRIQSLQMIFRLFRWRSGRFQFHPAEHLEYDEKHFVPISAETVLMEGARMIDEWPIIERRIKSDTHVFRQTPAAAALDASVDAIVDRDMDATNEVAGSAAPVRLTADERNVLKLVDGTRTVKEIGELSPLGEFDTLRILADLLTRKLVEETAQKSPAPAALARGHRLVDRSIRVALYAVVALLAAVGLFTLRANPIAPWRLLGDEPAIDQLRYYASHNRLERIEQAIEVFYFDAGSFPDRLDLLAQNEYLPLADLVDPWGRPYLYRLTPGGYEIHARGADGELERSMSVHHRFSGLQRMMAGAGDAPRVPPAEALD